MHRVHSEYKATRSSMYNIKCRSGILHSTNRADASNSFTWDKNCSLFWKLQSSVLHFLFIVEQLCRHNLQNDHTIYNTTSYSTFLLKESVFSGLYFSSDRVSAEHRCSFSAAPCFTLLHGYSTCLRAAVRPQASSRHHCIVSTRATYLAQGQGHSRWRAKSSFTPMKNHEQISKFGP